MITLLTMAFNYVTSDPYFLGSMSFTVIIGIYIGAVIHNGDLKQFGKTLLSLFCYSSLILMVNLTRIIPQIKPATLNPSVSNQPFASVVTVFLVTAFYLMGMFLGVKLVKYAHRLKKT